MTRPKVFCIGLGKTGTTSLKEALKILGYRTIRLPIDWKGITDFDAALPGVSAAMYRELDIEYPGSKFILTLRGVEGWLKSIKRDMERKQGVRRGRAQERAQLLEMLYGTSSFDSDRFRLAFQEHKKDVLAYFKDRPDDLLVLDVTQHSDWDNLCEFLNVAVPEEPFPFANKASDQDDLLVRLLYVTRDMDVVARISKYSRRYVEALAHRADVDVYDMNRPNYLEDDRRINKIIKRACAYFGGTEKTAEALNIPEETIKLALERQEQHANAKKESKGRNRWIRRLFT